MHSLKIDKGDRKGARISLIILTEKLKTILYHAYGLMEFEENVSFLKCCLHL